MNALFGDATTATATPVSRAADSHSIRGGSISGANRRSESPSSLRLGSHGADMAVPGLDIEPPAVTIKNGRPVLSLRQNSDASSVLSAVSAIRTEGLGGWISNMVQRGNKGEDGEGGSGGSGKYRRIEGDGDV